MKMRMNLLSNKKRSEAASGISINPQAYIANLAALRSGHYSWLTSYDVTDQWASYRSMGKSPVVTCPFVVPPKKKNLETAMALGFDLVEHMGVEPTTSYMRSKKEPFFFAFPNSSSVLSASYAI